ncbi:nitroreductase family protein [Thermohalobacter berrensis]|uniref:Nitroreductase n=1 Tax=Thermohalobacter berrensis TaxID=99594 RepID=A0A419T4J6_9FIRM|nr:nitroreductase family protein [Thermohalobacter berrensis]RKD32464.1 nitroreductase [Thermohalobacter berrensis]
MLLDLLKKRCSVRKFLEKDIPKETINYILEAGRLSPSGGNEQPWKFGVITDKGLIKEISKLAYNQKWIETANLLIVLCTTIVSDERGGRDIQMARFPKLKNKIKEMDKELYSKLNQEEHQTKIPGTHMVLAALEHGIGSTWISYFKVDELSKLLNLPKNYIPSEIIAFGYPAKEMKPVKKKSIDEILFYNKKLFKQ